MLLHLAFTDEEIEAEKEKKRKSIEESKRRKKGVIPPPAQAPSKGFLDEGEEEFRVIVLPSLSSSVIPALSHHNSNGKNHPQDNEPTILYIQSMKDDPTRQRQNGYNVHLGSYDKEKEKEKDKEKEKEDRYHVGFIGRVMESDRGKQIEKDKRDGVDGFLSLEDIDTADYVSSSSSSTNGHNFLSSSKISSSHHNGRNGHNGYLHTHTHTHSLSHTHTPPPPPLYKTGYVPYIHPEELDPTLTHTLPPYKNGHNGHNTHNGYYTIHNTHNGHYYNHNTHNGYSTTTTTTSTAPQPDTTHTTVHKSHTHTLPPHFPDLHNGHNTSHPPHNGHNNGLNGINGYHLSKGPNAYGLTIPGSPYPSPTTTTTTTTTTTSFYPPPPSHTSFDVWEGGEAF